MDKKQLDRLASNPKFVEGIYNYCDRWCERCSFTSRCMNYALSEEEYADPEARDINNKKFWDKLSENFKAVFEMVQEMTEEQGIDLDSEDLESIEKEEKIKKEKIKSHFLSKAGMKYIVMVDSWFDSSEDLFKHKEDELQIHASCGIPGYVAEAVSIEDSVEIIHWYQHQIYVKILRALDGSDRDFEGADEFPSDSDGSAKVALIGIDRSIVAWGRLMNQFPDQENMILDICVHLEKLRNGAEKIFPNAREFIRPGFDTV